jgi:hypothetical protein
VRTLIIKIPRRSPIPKTEQSIDKANLDLVPPLAAIEVHRDGGRPRSNEGPALASAGSTSDENVWRSDNPDVVLVSQPAIVMYLNTQRQVVIRQEQLWNEDDDSYVYISVENIDLIIARLQSLKADAKAGA